MGRLVQDSRGVKQVPGVLGRNATKTKSLLKEEKQRRRLAENKEYLSNSNVKAFLAAIAKAEGGDYNFMYGAAKGKRKDPWRFSDYSTHPGAGQGGVNTAAGMYQIIKKTWRNCGERMGLTDFTPATQDLIAIEIMRDIGIIDYVRDGNIDVALPKAAIQWAALPQGSGKPGAYDQPYMEYDVFIATYKKKGGSVK